MTVMIADPWEHAARAFEPPKRDPSFAKKYSTPGALAQAIDPLTVQTPALDLLDASLVDVAEGRCRRLIWSMAPQEGKSQRVSRTFPAWVLVRNPDTRIAIASYELGTARRWGRAIRNDIAEQEDKLGLRVRQDTSAAHEWQLDGSRGGVYSVGIGGALTGRPVDLLLIDDPLKGRAEADSAAYRERCWDWWTDVARTRLAPGAPVVLIMTRWSEDDLAGRLIANDHLGEWRVINIPTQAEVPNPDARPPIPPDPLGRTPGEYLVSTRGRTVEDWEATRRDVGSRTWNALYQGRPAPVEGAMLKRAWWKFYDSPRAVRLDDGSMSVPNVDELIMSWDMAFKDTRHSDFVVGQVWGRRDTEVFLLDQARGRWDFTETCRQVEALTAKWPQASAKLVEDKANGPAVIVQLQSKVPGLIPITPKDSKEARVSAVSPFVEAGNVWLPAPALAPWVTDFVEEMISFPNATHDDQVDAMSQAVSRLLLGQNSAQQAMDWLNGYKSA